MEKIRKHLKSNKGMSIMELLLVIMISLLILTLLLVSYNVVNNANITKAAKRMENVLKTTKVAAMSRGQAAGVVNFVVENGRLFAVTAPGTADEQKELICNANVVVSAGMGSMPGAGTDSVGATVAFNTNGRIRTSVTTADHFLLTKGERQFKIVVYKDTGAIECGMYSPEAEPDPGEGAGGG